MFVFMAGFGSSAASGLGSEFKGSVEVRVRVRVRVNLLCIFCCILLSTKNVC